MPLYNPSQSAALYEPAAATIPAVANFAWVNQGTATATSTSNGVYVVCDNDNEVHALVATAPAAPYDVYMRTSFDLYQAGASTVALDSLCGIVLRDSSSGRLLECGLNLGRQATTLSPLYSFLGLGLRRCQQVTPAFAFGIPEELLPDLGRVIERVRVNHAANHACVRHKQNPVVVVNQVGER